MSLTNQQFKNRLINLNDPSTLCDILEIKSEDIVERFEDIIEEKEMELRDLFDVDYDDELDDDS
jgi:hypothetical protein